WFSILFHVYWYSALIYTLQNPQRRQEKKPDCPICGEDFNIGKHYVQLPCQETHFLHETCLTDFAAHTLNIFCPLCCSTFWL
ncbi:hypothetical protein DFH28DRAFT_907970, partial [Melampsora americana]